MHMMKKTAGKGKLSKAVLKVLATPAAVPTVLVGPVDLFFKLTFVVGRCFFSNGLLFGGGLLKDLQVAAERESSSLSEGWLSLQMEAWSAFQVNDRSFVPLGCLITGIAHRQVWVIWVIPPTTWRMKMVADALSQNVFFYSGCSLNFPSNFPSFCLLISCLVKTKNEKHLSGYSDVVGLPWRFRFCASDRQRASHCSSLHWKL